MPIYVLYGESHTLADPDQRLEYPTIEAALAGFVPPTPTTCAVLMIDEQPPVMGDELNPLTIVHVFKPGTGWQEVGPFGVRSWYELWA